MTTVHTTEVQGLNIFYRQAGDPSSPKLLLLGGFPSSSHQFRNLIPALAHRFHVLSVDYPGFGNSDMPDPATWDYTFDHIADIVDGLLTKISFTGPMGIYMQDYSGPIGNRLIARHPDWLAWQVIQNANSYEEGLTAVWDGIRHALWADRNPQTEAPLEAFLQPDTVQAIYTTGGGEAYLRDLSDAALVRLDSGHFAVEDRLDQITASILRFYDTRVRQNDAA